MFSEPDYYNKSGLPLLSADHVGRSFLSLARVVRSFPHLHNSMIVGPDIVYVSKSGDYVQR